MKKIFCLIAGTLALLVCERSATLASNNNQQYQERSKTGTVTAVKINQPHHSIHPRNLFTLSDAEKILGQQAHLTDSASTIQGDVSTYKCSYTANYKDPKTGKTGVIYIMFEEYAQVSSAKKVYSSIKTANENHEGVKELHDLADEAYFHSDGENFYFILVRK